MKKILYSFMLLFAATLCFTACSDDDDDNGSIQMPADPAANIAGTYVGTWTSTNQTTGAVITADDVVSLTEGETPYVATLTIDSCKAISLTAIMTSPVNVSWNSGNVYNFFNKTTTNELGTSFAGKVYDGTTMDFTFTKTIRSGRKSTVYTLTFNGTKQ